MQNCRLIANDAGLFAGSLALGTLDHALHLPWLEYHGISHVVNCFGKFGAAHDITDEWRIAIEERYAGIEYLNRCPNDPRQLAQYVPFFAALAAVLKQPGKKVLVHCRSGRDRSAFAIVALLQLHCGVSFADAQNFLRVRRNCYGQPFVDLDVRDPDAQQWLQREVALSECPLPGPLGDVSIFRVITRITPP